jgi:hypothetical protein
MSAKITRACVLDTGGGDCGILDSPKVVTEWLTFLLHIREVLGSSLGPETGYPE